MTFTSTQPRYFYASGQIWDRGAVPDGRVVAVDPDRARWLCAYFRGEAKTAQVADPKGAEFLRSYFIALHDALGAWRQWRFGERAAA